MKMNKKGITLVELIVSISLISIVIMFLFRLLVDVRYNENNTDFNRANQQTRAIIVKNIQTDFLERKLIQLEDFSDEEKFILQFTYADHTTATLTADLDSISYTNDAGTEKWVIEKENENTHLGVHCVSYSTSLSNETLKEESDFFYVKFTIPVIVNSKRKNYVDDLEFFYLGEKRDIENINDAFPNRIALGDYQANQCG